MLGQFGKKSYLCIREREIIVISYLLKSYRDMKQKTEFYYKVLEEYNKLEQKLGSALLLDEIYINIEINELARMIKAIAVRNNIDIDL
jgi:hypothetical protein